MNIKILVLFALISFTFAACDLTTESNYTPDIFFLQNPINNKIDTLNRYYTDKAGVLLMDTITVGDTVLFALYLEGYANNLTSFDLKGPEDSSAIILLPDKVSMDSIFLPTSEYDKGKFIMDGTHTALVFPFWYVAKKVSNATKIGFAITSDAKFSNMFGSNSNSFELKTPIKAQ